MALSFAAPSSEDFSPSTAYLVCLSAVRYPGSSRFMTSATTYQHDVQMSAV